MVGAIGFHCVLSLLVTSWNFAVLRSLLRLKMPCAWNCTVLEPGAVPTVAAATGAHSGVGVGVGVLDLVGEGFGVGTGGVPGQTLSPIIAKGFSTVVALLEPPPPQLMISAAAKKDSTGTSTRHRRRQIIKP